MSSNNLILIGFMGSGKSTIGRKLVQKLKNSYFLDTDNLIETFEDRTISKIFEVEGENYFRKAEKRVFNWIKQNVQNSVISTGGGLPIFVPEIKEAGIVIYLKVDFENIVSRLSKKEIEKRPLFQDLNKAKELFFKRDVIYSELADYIIDNKNLDDTINKILSIRGKK